MLTQPTIAPSRAPQAAAAEAQQQQLLSLVQDHFNGFNTPEEVAEEIAIPIRSEQQALGHAMGRQAALRERCHQALGDLFLPVYDYLKQAREMQAREEGLNENDVRRSLLQLVGSERLNECMCVDELIFTESMGS